MKKENQKSRSTLFYRIILPVLLIVLILSLILIYSKSPAIAECYKLDSEDGRDVCIKREAVSALDPKLCGHISTQSSANKCSKLVEAMNLMVQSGQYDAVFQGLAIKPLPLSELYEYDMLFSEFAIASGNPIFCLEPASQRDKDKCYKRLAFTHNNSGACKAIEDVEKRDTCFMQLALAGNKIECELIEDTSLRNSCFALNVT